MIVIGQILNGLVLGSMYALIALGYSLVLGSLHRLNLAHPQIFMVGGFVAVFITAHGLSIWVGLPVAFLVGGAIGLLIERISFSRLASEDSEIAAALSSVAIGIVIIDLVQKAWGPEPVPLTLGPDRAALRAFGVRFTSIQISVVFTALVLMVALTLLINRTRLGRSIRAVADNATHATLLGIDVAAVTRRVFFLASGLGCVAGLLLAFKLGTASSTIGFEFGLKALAVMAIGGVGDLRGAVVGGLVVGVIESLAVNYGFGQLTDLLVWGSMIVVLILRPQGLFGSGNQESRA